MGKNTKRRRTNTVVPVSISVGSDESVKITNSQLPPTSISPANKKSKISVTSPLDKNVMDNSPKSMEQSLTQIIHNLREDLDKKLSENFEQVRKEFSKQNEEISKSLEFHREIISANLVEELTKVRNEITDEFISVRKELSDVEKKLQRNFDSSFWEIKNAQNNAEQNARNFSIRIHGLQMPDNVKYPNEVCAFAFKEVLLPILKFALDESVPAWESIIEYGHLINIGKSRSPVVALRFFSRRYVDLVMRNKMKVLGKNDDRYKNIYVNPSMTKANYLKFKEIKSSVHVKKVWFKNRIFFTIHGDVDAVFTVRNLKDSVEDIMHAMAKPVLKSTSKELNHPPSNPVSSSPVTGLRPVTQINSNLLGSHVSTSQTSTTADDVSREVHNPAGIGVHRQ